MEQVLLFAVKAILTIGLANEVAFAMTMPKPDTSLEWVWKARRVRAMISFGCGVLMIVFAVLFAWLQLRSTP